MARCISRASVGCATAFGCTVVSTATPLQVLGADGASLVRDRQAFLDERDELLLAEPLAPARHRRSIEREPVAEAHSPQKYWQ